MHGLQASDTPRVRSGLQYGLSYRVLQVRSKYYLNLGLDTASRCRRIVGMSSLPNSSPSMVLMEGSNSCAKGITSDESTISVRSVIWH